MNSDKIKKELEHAQSLVGWALAVAGQSYGELRQVTYGKGPPLAKLEDYGGSASPPPGELLAEVHEDLGFILETLVGAHETLSDLVAAVGGHQTQWIEHGDGTLTGEVAQP